MKTNLIWAQVLMMIVVFNSQSCSKPKTTKDGNTTRADSYDESRIGDFESEQKAKMLELEIEDLAHRVGLFTTLIDATDADDFISELFDIESTTEELFDQAAEIKAVRTALILERVKTSLNEMQTEVDLDRASYYKSREDDMEIYLMDVERTLRDAADRILK